MRAVVVDYTLEEDLARGSVIAKDFINKIRKRYWKKYKQVNSSPKISCRNRNERFDFYIRERRQILSEEFHV
jgi:hypothetical protein